MQLGQRISDGGLRLGVVQWWLETGGLPDLAPWFDHAVQVIRADDELWEGVGDARSLALDEPDILDRVLLHTVVASAELVVDDDALSGVEALQFDGGNDVYCDLVLEALAERLGREWWELDTGGETDAFAVRSLAGCLALPALTELDLDGHGFVDGGHDLSPLAGHPQLAALRNARVARGAEALLSCPRLTEVSNCRGLPAAVVSALQERGVTGV